MNAPEPKPQLGTRDSVRSFAHTHEFTIAVGRRVSDVYPRSELVTIQQLAERWRVPDSRRGKLSSAEYHALDKMVPDEKARRGREKDGEYFVAAEFGDDGRRLGENIRSLTAFVLDFDSGKTTRETIEDRLAGLAYSAYTSYSHLPDAPRWRVVVPYTHPITPDQHRRVYEHFQHLFDGDLDPSCAKPAQIYFTPACPHDAMDQYEMLYREGDLFDPNELPVPDADPVDLDEAGEPGPTESAGDELARLKDALTFLDPDPRDLWIKVGMAIKHDLGDDGMATWLEWSQRSSKFSMSEAVTQWNSLKPKSGGLGVGVGTVYYLAQNAGWKPATTRVPPSIAKLNEEHFVARYGGKAAVFCEVVDPIDGHPRIEPLSPADFRLLYDNQKAWSDDAYGNPKRIPLGRYWLEHRARREYKGVIFAPGAPADETLSYYNLWRGFAVEAKEGAWELMQSHLLNAICGGDQRYLQYLLGWMAYAVQHPDRPAEVAVVLRGGRGAGKGVFARSFGKLFGPHYLQITQARHLTGNFNKHLESCVVLFVDEGFWAGDKQGEGTLKGLVTEPTLAVERKYFDVVTARNCLHIIIASNSEWVVPAGADERRFFVLEVDDARKQDPAYFGPLYAEMHGAGLAAMLYDLQHRDLSRFDIRDVPQSKALGEQKVRSMTPAQKWWFGKLIAEEFSDHGPYGGTRYPWGRVPTDVVHADYVHSIGKTGVTRKQTETELGMNLLKLLPPGTKLRVRVTLNGQQVPHHDFPPLELCRDSFEKLMRLEGGIDWTSGVIT